MKKRNLKHSDHWITPDYIYTPLNKEFNFDFDPCPIISQDKINPENDGLIINWGTKNFINPPYSMDLKKAFVERAVEFKNKGRLCVLLLPVSTSTKLFHEIILPNYDEIRFVKGRIKFIYGGQDNRTMSKGNSMHDSMIVIFDGRK